MFSWMRKSSLCYPIHMCVNTSVFFSKMIFLQKTGTLHGSWIDIIIRYKNNIEDLANK